MHKNRHCTLADTDSSRVFAAHPVDAAHLVDDPARLSANNHRDGGLVVLGKQWSDRINSQVLVDKESAGRAQAGASLAALVGTTTVAFVDTGVLATTGSTVTPHRVTAGTACTLASKLSSSCVSTRDKIDPAPQLQQQSGRAFTEYWRDPGRRSLQLAGSDRF